MGLLTAMFFLVSIACAGFALWVDHLVRTEPTFGDTEAEQRMVCWALRADRAGDALFCIGLGLLFSWGWQLWNP